MNILMAGYVKDYNRSFFIRSCLFSESCSVSICSLLVESREILSTVGAGLMKTRGRLSGAFSWHEFNLNERISVLIMPENMLFLKMWPISTLY